MTERAMITAVPPTKQPPAERFSDLTERQEGVLRLIVHEYVTHGRPVGSKHLTERYDVGFSPATMRGEMAELESGGYVEHLHTSGGRIPTDQGYRYYVENLMSEVMLPPGDQIMIRHQFRQAESQLEEWPDLAATVLADIAGNVSLVTVPRVSVARVRHIDLVSLQPRLALMILVTLETNVRQVMLHLPEDTSRDRLNRVANELSDRLFGLSSVEVGVRPVEADQIDQAVIRQVIATLQMVDAADQTGIRSSGLENMVGQPDVNEGDLSNVLGLLRGGDLLSAILPQLIAGPNVQVFIGDEQLPGALKRLGIIVATYGVDNEVTGLVGVLGPTRMSYWRTISTVRYMSELVSDLVSDLYALDEEVEAI